MNSSDRKNSEKRVVAKSNQETFVVGFDTPESLINETPMESDTFAKGNHQVFLDRNGFDLRPDVAGNHHGSLWC